MNDQMKCLRVIFEGRVQGVGFRYTVKDLAKGFEVVGWVKNEADGTVEMQVMGEAAEVAEFLQEITKESAVAHHIQRFTVETISPLVNCSGFKIER